MMWREAWIRLRGDLPAVVSALVLLAVAGGALVAPAALAHAPEDQDPHALLLAPLAGASHLLGTDELGRDVLARLAQGTRLSLFLALAATVTALGVGTVYGGISGYVGGRTDGVLMRIVDALYAFPDLLLLILLTTLLGRGLLGMYLALSLTSWVFIARLVRGEVLRLKEREFVLAERALGAPHSAILLRGIAPNLLGVLIVTVTFRLPVVILAECTLGFIGLGLTPPHASLGTMANTGWEHMRFSPHLILCPAAVIVALALAFNVLGDTLRDATDPRRKTTSARH